MKKSCKPLMLSISLCYVLLAACSKESQTNQRVKLTNEVADAPNNENVPENYILEYSEDCKFIGNRHPDSGYSTIRGTLECYNKKPKWWPNFNQKIVYPTWVWQHEGGYDPNDPKKLLLYKPAEEAVVIPRTDKDEIYEILAARTLLNFPIRQRHDILTTADLGLTDDEVLFLDNYFAEKIMTFDGLRSFFPNRLLSSGEDEAMLQIYMIFKSRIFLSPRPNFYGENNTGHMNQFMFDEYSNNSLYTNWNIPQYWLYRATQVGSALNNAPMIGQQLYVILPKYYLYLMIDPAGIPDYLFVE